MSQTEILPAVALACAANADGWATATEIRRAFDGGDHANRWAAKLWELEADGLLEVRRVSTWQYVWRPSARVRVLAARPS